MKKLEEMTPKELEKHIRNLKQNIEEEATKIDNIRKVIKHKKEECCPDVCNTIDDAISKLTIELNKAKTEKAKIHKVIITASKVFQTEQRQTKSLERQTDKKVYHIEELLNEQIESLKSLKKTLNKEDICYCD